MKIKLLLLCIILIIGIMGCSTDTEGVELTYEVTGSGTNIIAYIGYPEGDPVTFDNITLPWSHSHTNTQPAAAVSSMTIFTDSGGTGTITANIYVDGVLNVTNNGAISDTDSIYVIAIF